MLKEKSAKTETEVKNKWIYDELKHKNRFLKRYEKWTLLE